MSMEKKISSRLGHSRKPLHYTPGSKNLKVFIKTHFNKLVFIQNITLAFILLICPGAKLSFNM